MPDQLTDRARKAAEEIAADVFKKLGKRQNDCPPDCDQCHVHAECKAKECVLIEYLTAIIERHIRDEWKFEDIPTGVRVLVAAEYHDGSPNRVGIGEVYIEDGKKGILVDDGIERLSLDLPLTVYAWCELPTPPPNVAKEAAPCPKN